MKEQLTGTVLSLRHIIKSDREQKIAKDNQGKNSFENAEQLMDDLNSVLPKGQAGRNMSEEEEQRIVDEILDEVYSQDEAEGNAREERKNSILNRMYSVVPVKYPQNSLFETENLLDGKIVIKLNVNHPFYEKVINPLCGDISDEDSTESYNDKIRTRDAIMLLLMSHAKAVASFPEDNQDLFENLLTQWGTILNSAVKKLDSK